MQPIQIYIPFAKWSLWRLLLGVKTATTRTKTYGSPGDWFEVDFSQIGLDVTKTYRLVDIKFVPLLEIVTRWYKEEGCLTPEEFIDIWNEIHPKRGYDPEQNVNLHLFEMTKYELRE